MKIVVYGIGNNGKAFCKDVFDTYKNIEIVAVMDSYVCDSGLMIPFIRLSEVHNYIFDYIVITPAKHQKEIKESLLNAGVSGEKIIFLEEAKEIFADLRCELCGRKVWVWENCGFQYDIFNVKKIIGASVRRGMCPICGSMDRERFVYHIIKNYTKLLNGRQKDVLHFAPEVMLSKKIKAACGKKYISADIVQGVADMTADITCLPFKDRSFDYVICNHVMEHVILEEKAFMEVRRCLRVDGIMIFTAPICWEQKTLEGVDRCEEDRIRFYGQEDHVRLYGNDIVERIKRYGFQVRLLRCNEIMEEDEANRKGYITEDSVLLCRPDAVQNSCH